MSEAGARSRGGGGHGGGGLGVGGAAAYLACSWTWCIGMWLPVYLTRDFGWLGWVAFAVPNVIGAASVGFVLRGRESAGRLLGEHRWAMVAFSVWTVLFHAAFLGMMLRDLPFVNGEVVGFAVLVLVVLFAALPLGRAVIAAVVVWVLSVGFGIAADVTSGAGDPAFVLPPRDGTFGMGALAMTTPVLVFGFLACPYLDATLVGVRERMGDDGRRARLAFALGFGLLFLAMILMTLGYAGRMIRTGSLSYWIIPAHLAIQSAFTVGVHLRALGERGVIHLRVVSGGGPGKARAVRRSVFGWTIGLVAAAYAVAMVGLAVRLSGWEPRSGYAGTRLLYDVFLGAYALPFPAYVWTVVVGVRRFGLTRRGALIGWAVSVAAGLPLVAVGAIGQRHEWLVAAVVVGLLGPVVGRVWGKARSGEATKGTLGHDQGRDVAG